MRHLYLFLALTFLCGLTACPNPTPGTGDDDDGPPPTPLLEPGDGLEFAIIREGLGNTPLFLGNHYDAALWVRLAGAGEDQSQRTVRAGIWDLGDNGVWDNGYLDDILLQEVTRNITWAIDGWTRRDTSTDDPPVMDSNTGVFTAGETTGTARVEANHPVWGSASDAVLVTAPDWCPGLKRCS